LKQALDALVGPKRLGLYAWLSLISQILIVVTGGVVRLTGSGLGCPTWPKCTEDSLVTVPEMGIHGIIEFANRLLTFALALIALLTIVTVLRSSELSKRLALRFPAIALLLGIPAQAVLGGFTVLTKLNPWLVGAHFVLSGIMIALASLLLSRTYNLGGERQPSKLRAIAALTLVVGWIAVLVGVLVTGAGPHSGDAESVRNGLDLETWQHYHSYPAYLTLALAVAGLIAVLRRDGGLGSSRQALVSWLLFISLAIQAVIGVIQSRLGVPPLLVGLHLLGASTIIALLHLQWLFTFGKKR
jgi:cytochrome c oxidase assembly protein subunit 15